MKNDRRCNEVSCFACSNKLCRVLERSYKSNEKSCPFYKTKLQYKAGLRKYPIIRYSLKSERINRLTENIAEILNNEVTDKSTDRTEVENL